RVKKILVKEGDLISKGDVLAVMDRTQLEGAENAFDLANTSHERMKNLKEAGVIPQSQWEQSQMQFKQASLGLSSSEENTRIAAPFSGVVTAVTKEAGEIYSGMPSGQTIVSGLIQIADLSSMKMDMMVSENTVIKLAKGQKVNLYLDIWPDKVFQGNIFWINPAADPITKTFKVRVEIKNTNRQLRPGFYGRAIIHIQEKKNVLNVPPQAVIDNRYVFIVDKENKAYRRDVITGIGNENEVEILEGIKAGERVVITGSRGLSDGIEIIETN
ncbi:MAG: efflux RND transporter periplasmic adaptor subunit, partial [bacterium]